MNAAVRAVNRLPRGWLATFALLAIFAGHVLLTFYFERPESFLNDLPVMGADFDTHYGQASRFVDAMRGYGKTWSYDPSLLAGRPAGVFFDCDNKAWNFWTYALHAAGLSKGLAFNTFVIAAFLAIPWLVFLGARLFGFELGAAVLAAAVASALWFFDSQTHYFWWIGMITWTLGSAFSLIPLGLFYRFCRAPRRGTGELTAITLALCLFIHPFTFFVLFLPMALLYLRARPGFTREQRWGVLGIAVFAIVANAFWLWPVLRFRHYFLESPYYSLAPVSALFTDFLELAMDPNDTGMFMRTAFRFLFWGLGVAGLILWKRASDDRFAPFTLAVAALLAEAYLGRYLPLTSHIQPYRFVVPATLLLSLAAVAFVTHAGTRAAFANAAWPARAVLVALSVCTFQFLVHDILFFFPELIPKQQGRGPEAFEIVTPTGYPRNYDHRHPLPFSGGDPAARWFEARQPLDGRILVEPPVLGERLAALVPGAEVMGGIRERNQVHTLSNFFRKYPEREASADEFARYLERYAIRWVVLEMRRKLPAGYERLLRPAGDLPDLGIYEVVKPASFFASGSGHLRASLNRIQVTNTDPAVPIVLRYHYLETLVCEPGCKLEREAVPGAPLHFVRIPAPHPRNFVLRNAY
ncbi:MAG TPA: hypothetical protein VK524_32460 [Polyangiaceae bacterium]|nr:hypothetical protein [Polyangiaceae bacterium]